MSEYIKYENGVINLDHVTSVDVGSDATGGQLTFHMVNGDDVVFGTAAATKADALLALVRMTRALDTEIYDIRNY